MSKVMLVDSHLHLARKPVCGETERDRERTCKISPKKLRRPLQKQGRPDSEAISPGNNTIVRNRQSTSAFHNIPVVDHDIPINLIWTFVHEYWQDGPLWSWFDHFCTIAIPPPRVRGNDEKRRAPEIYRHYFVSLASRVSSLANAFSA